MGYLEVNRVAGQFHVSPGKSLSMGGMTIQLAVREQPLTRHQHTVDSFDANRTIRVWHGATENGP
jgi:hypothetical protein